MARDTRLGICEKGSHIACTACASEAHYIVKQFPGRKIVALCSLHNEALNMKLPSNLQSLLRASSSQMVQRMAEAWQCAPSELPEVLLEESRLYLQLDDCDKNSRWLLFELLDRGGAAEVEGFPRIVVQREGEADIRELRDRGLVFVVASGEPPIPYFVLPEELRRGVHHYREQLLLMMLDGQISQLNERSKPTQPFELPPQIKPNMALSQLVASSDPEGFRYPLSRAFAIPRFISVEHQESAQAALA